MEKKTLSVPSSEYIEQHGYPKNKADALKIGSSRFLPEDGNLRIIRNYNSQKYPTGRVETDKNRKLNKGNRVRRKNETWSSSKHKTEATKFKNEIKAYNNGANPWNEKLNVDDERFRRVEHDLKISDKLFKNADMPFSSGDRANLIWTTPNQWRPKDSFEQIYGDKYVASLDRFTGDTRYIDRNVYDPWQHTHDQGQKLEPDFAKVLPKKVNSKRLFRNLASVAGQSNNPLVNVGGDLVGAVIDGVSYMGDPSRERAIDVLLSTGQAVTSLGAVGLALVPIPGSRFAGYALMKVGDNIGKAERIWNLAREGAIRDTKKIRGGSIDPWKIK
tara:strand:- start:72 stop:1061 length:990 start_codon:yes stop_codon:yes gene_type:complete